MSLTAEQIEDGELSLQNVSGVDITLAKYGAYVIDDGVTLNILDRNTDPRVMAAGYEIGRTMIGQATMTKPPRFTSINVAIPDQLELAALLRDGNLKLVADRMSNPPVEEVT